jgi:hypothetical protein
MSYPNSRDHITEAVAAELENQELLAAEVALVAWDVVYSNFQAQTPQGVQTMTGYGIIFTAKALADLGGAVALGSNDIIAQAQVLPGTFPPVKAIALGVKEGLENLKQARINACMQVQAMQQLQAQQAQTNGQGELPPDFRV